MKKLILLIFLFTITNAMATPKSVEVWFLSIDKTSFLDSILPQIKYSKKTAQNYQCQPMGEYCFDPQIGLYKKDDSQQIIKEKDYSELDSKEVYKSVGEYKDSPFSTCDNNGNFDIFCGKTKETKINKKAKLELWIDTSSSMKQMDFDGYDKVCRRETFLKQINSTCPLNEKMKVYVFDENKRELGSFNQLCVNVGLNRTDRIMRDIKASNANHLIIVTDIFEATAEFVDYIEALPKGSTRGVNKPMYAKDLKTEISRLEKVCK